uniref:Hypothetical_protein n=1 Tax=Oryza brachyantha TaxID=4533 RepID=G2XM52_ORYBR|nr:hypothetical_protein [Oryza brachyantha]
MGVFCRSIAAANTFPCTLQEQSEVRFAAVRWATTLYDMKHCPSRALLTILNERLAKLLSENDTKAIQKILISLGHLSWNELSFAHLKNALDLIFSLSRSNETNFVPLSQATNYLTGDAPLLVSVNSNKRSGCEESHAMAREEIIKRLFDTLIYSSRKVERCAGTFWLVSLAMYCGQHPKILELLPQIQVCQTMIRYLDHYR